MLPMLCVLYYYAYISVLCISSYSRMPVVCFCGLRPQTPTGIRPRTLLGYFRSQTPNLPTMENPKGAHGLKETTIQYYAPTLPLCAQSF